MAKSKAKAAAKKTPASTGKAFKSFEELRADVEQLYLDTIDSIAAYKKENPDGVNFNPLYSLQTSLKANAVRMGSDLTDINKVSAIASTNGKYKDKDRFRGVNPFRAGSVKKEAVAKAANSKLRATVDNKKEPQASTTGGVVADDVDKIKAEVADFLENIAEYNEETIGKLSPVIIKSAAKTLAIEKYEEMKDDELILQLALKAEDARNAGAEKE